MKFRNKIEMCRHDDKVAISVFMGLNYDGGDVHDCLHYKEGKCMLDKKKCEIVTYVKEVRNEKNINSVTTAT
jgi:hypothetical protein